MTDSSRSRLGRTLLLIGRLALAAIFIVAAIEKMKPQPGMDWSFHSINLSLLMFSWVVDSYQILPSGMVTLFAQLASSIRTVPRTLASQRNCSAPFVPGFIAPDVYVCYGAGLSGRARPRNQLRMFRPGCAGGGKNRANTRRRSFSSSCSRSDNRRIPASSQAKVPQLRRRRPLPFPSAPTDPVRFPRMTPYPLGQRVWVPAIS